MFLAAFQSQAHRIWHGGRLLSIMSVDGDNEAAHEPIEDDHTSSPRSEAQGLLTSWKRETENDCADDEERSGLSGSEHGKRQRSIRWMALALISCGLGLVVTIASVLSFIREASKSGVIGLAVQRLDG